ncbi:dna repair protein rad51 homolog 3 [Lichtheimia corymbifera JMRC:FSU:9682]|uniref:DNA repair protein RAD51 homolog 3 n=1 Tax=Lichtheimia corymbifera JMRC:FSU:9682 TaxID=1263082 RepID=A0A068RTV8_9FUNG|nr:dna repair protein rad51 homolog 3 [Lichtheimia corymbifera JMRC:FSU:9682]
MSTTRSIAEAPPELQQKLENAGYETIDDIKEAGVLQVIQELQLSSSEVTVMLSLVQGGQIHSSQSAKDRLVADSSKTGISCTSRALNNLFASYKGIPYGCITEFCGEAGSGKTQLSMQLAVNALLPSELGGCNGECIYIDTEGGLVPKRLRTIATAMQNQYPDQVESDDLLSKIHVFRVFDHCELIALIRQLPDILSEMSQIKLLIIDTITFPLRLNISDIRLRNSLPSFLGRTLLDIANKHAIAVAVTNQVTTDRVNEALTPALGASWGHWCANRVFLYRRRDKRFAYLYKSSLGVSDRTVQFKISDHGIEDGIEQEADEQEQNENMTQDDCPWNTMNNEEDLFWDADADDHQKPEAQPATGRIEQPKPLTPHPPTLMRDSSMQEATIPSKRKQPEQSSNEHDGWSSGEEDDYRFLAGYEDSPSF